MYDVEVPAVGPPQFVVAAGSFEPPVFGAIALYVEESFVEDVGGFDSGDTSFYYVDYVPGQSWIHAELGPQSLAGPAFVLSLSPGSIFPIQILKVQGVAEDFTTYSVGFTTALSPAAYFDGFIWWCEVTQEGGLSFSLRRARPDLSEVTTVSSVTVTNPTGGGDLVWLSGVPGLAVGPDVVLVEWGWADGTVVGPPEGTVRLRFPLGAGSATFAFRDPPQTFTGVAVAPPEGGFVWADGVAVLHTDGSTAVDAEWLPDYYAPGSPPTDVEAERVSLTPAGGLAVWGGLVGGRGLAVTPPGGPTEVYVLETHPEQPTLGVGWPSREE